MPKDTFREDAAKAVNPLLRIGEETQVGVNRTAGFGMYKIIRSLQPLKRIIPSSKQQSTLAKKV